MYISVFMVDVRIAVLVFNFVFFVVSVRNFDI